MAAINDLIAQIQDPILRAKIEQEANKLSKQKKFGLVFEEHLPESTRLYGVPIRKGSMVTLKNDKSGQVFVVLRKTGDTAVCLPRDGGETVMHPLSDLVMVAEFGEPIYPYLEPLDSVCNAPDSDLWHTLIEADNYHALQLLEYLYAGKVDCIYIDPPYNTGAKDWKYNNDYSLCEACNNSTGVWYGKAYAYFANVAHAAITNRSDDDPDGITIQGVYPLRFVKQVLSMFCSTCNSDAPAFEPIKKFILDKNAVGLDKSKYKLCMYFTKSTVYKQTGIMVSMKSTPAGIETMALAEITAYPFGFILYLDPSETWDYQGTDITACADCGYDDKCDISMPWKIEEMNDIFPESYRSREEIIRQRNELKSKNS